MPDETKPFEPSAVVGLTADERVIVAKYRRAAEESAAAKVLVDRLAKMRTARELAVSAHTSAQAAARASGIAGAEFVVGAAKYRATGIEAKIFDAVGSKFSPAEKEARAAIERVRQERARIGAERLSKFEAAAGSADGSEQRLALRDMRDPDRRAALSNLARQGSLALCAAVLGKRADPISLGVDLEYLNTLRKVIVERFDPDGLKLEEELEAVEAAAEAALADHGRWFMELGTIVRQPQVAQARAAAERLDELAKL
jgi:hypothetical protein